MTLRLGEKYGHKVYIVDAETGDAIEAYVDENHAKHPIANSMAANYAGDASVYFELPLCVPVNQDFTVFWENTKRERADEFHFPHIVRVYDELKAEHWEKQHGKLRTEESQTS